MSFMFHPYPYVDHDAVNEVSVPGVSPVRGVIAVAKRIAALLAEGKNVGIDAYPGADTAALLNVLHQVGAGVRYDVVDAEALTKDPQTLTEMLRPYLPEDRDIDPVLLYGRRYRDGYAGLHDAAKVAALRERLAAEHGFVVAEDDPYRALRYAGKALPAIASFDTEGLVVYLTSFSKLISPGLRVGAAMVKNPALMRKLVVGKQSTDLHTPTLSQAITAEYLSRGLLPGHMAKILGMYREQLALMLRELAKLPVKAYPTEGGLFVWCEMDERVDALKLLQAAVQNNVAFVPGTHFYANGGHLNTLRLNFSNSTPEQIVQGVHLLEKSIQEVR